MQAIEDDGRAGLASAHSARGVQITGAICWLTVAGLSLCRASGCLVASEFSRSVSPAITEYKTGELGSQAALIYENRLHSAGMLGVAEASSVTSQLVLGGTEMRAYVHYAYTPLSAAFATPRRCPCVTLTADLRILVNELQWESPVWRCAIGTEASGMSVVTF